VVKFSKLAQSQKGLLKCQPTSQSLLPPAQGWEWGRWIQHWVSQSVSSSTGLWRSLILAEDIQQLVCQVHKHCKKIPVAKVNLFSFPQSELIVWSNPKQKQSLQLMDLCDNLIKRLSDHSPTPQQSNYEDIKRPVHFPLSFYIPLK